MNVHSRKALRALIEGGVTIEYERETDRLLLGWRHPGAEAPA